jgi:hypothetical protein
MDKNFIKDHLIALKGELIRFRLWVVVLFIFVSFGVLVGGYFWPKTFTTHALLYAEETTIIEPLLRGRAAVTNIDRSARAREIIYTRRIMEAAGREAGVINNNMLPELRDDMIHRIRSGLTISPQGPGKASSMSSGNMCPDRKNENSM